MIKEIVFLRVEKLCQNDFGKSFEKQVRWKQVGSYSKVFIPFFLWIGITLGLLHIAEK